MIKKPFDFVEVEPMEEDTDENMRMEDRSSMSLFNDYPVTDANESGKSQIAIGKYILLHEIFF